MDLRSGKGLGNSTNTVFSSSGEENPDREASKMVHEHAAQTTVDMALVLQEIRAGNEALSNKMNMQTAEINEFA